MKFTKESYFKRQTTLPEVGEKGQDLLQNATVLVIGCGGLGSPIAIYLATSGVGNIHLVDFDTISITNLHRQVFYKTDDVEKPKVQILANEIKLRAPFTKVTYTNKAIDKSSILELIAKFDVVVDGTDNLQVKYLINDACVLANKPLVYGSLYKFDGYIATFNVKDNTGEYSCNLRDAFPKIAQDVPNCEEAGTMNPIVGIIALLQVNEVVKLITNTGDLLTNKLMIYNSLKNSQLKINLKKNTAVNISDVFNKSSYIDAACQTQNPEWLISSASLKSRLVDKNIIVISVIKKLNTKIPFKVHHKIPVQLFNVENFKPDFNKKYVIVCQKGISSYSVTEKIKKKYPALQVFSLSGGIEKFIE